MFLYKMQKNFSNNLVHAAEQSSKIRSTWLQDDEMPTAHGNLVEIQ